MSEQYTIIKSFPDFTKTNFDLESYNQQFREKNILINARASRVYYPEHWGPLSIKAASGGTEHYLLNNSKYAVTGENYLIVNDGNYNGSYIDSDHMVESFTINFSTTMVKKAVTTYRHNHAWLLDNDGYLGQENIEFFEQLHIHDH